MLKLQDFRQTEISLNSISTVTGGKDKITWKGQREYSGGLHNICDIMVEGYGEVCNVIDDY